MDETKQRCYSVDLLKIVLAFMVVILHVNADGTGHALSAAMITPWRQLIGGVTILCYPAVNTYVLISGFFMYKLHKSIKQEFASLVKLRSSLVFFSILGYLFVSYGEKTFSLVELLKRFFPLIRNVWWFYTVYFALALISPYINKLIDCISLIEYRVLIIVSLLLCSILPMFVGWNDQIGIGYGYSLIWFMVLYLTGAYIYKYVGEIKRGAVPFIRWILLYGMVSVLIYVLPWPFSRLGIDITFAMYNSIGVLAQAVCLFMAFYSIEINSMLMKKVISVLGPLSMSSYIMHGQEDIEKVLWEFVKPYNYSNSSMIIGVWILLALGVFVAGSMIEYIRRKISQISRCQQNFVLKVHDAIDTICCTGGKNGIRK